MLMLSYVLKVKSLEINYLTFPIFAKKTKIIDLVWSGLVQNISDMVQKAKFCTKKSFLDLSKLIIKTQK